MNDFIQSFETQSQHIWIWIPYVHVCMYVCMYVYIYIYICMYILGLAAVKEQFK